MKKSHLLGTVFALTLFAMIGSGNAAIVAGDATSITSTGQSYAQMFASSSSFSDGAQELDELGDSVQTEPDEKLGYFIDGALPVASHHVDSHMDLWVLLIAAVLAGILSEVLHRRS